MICLEWVKTENGVWTKMERERERKNYMSVVDVNDGDDNKLLVLLFITCLLTNILWRDLATIQRMLMSTLTACDTGIAANTNNILI